MPLHFSEDELAQRRDSTCRLLAEAGIELKQIDCDNRGESS